MKTELKKWVLTFLPIVIIYVLLFHVFGLVYVSGSSMEPNYHDGDFRIMRRFGRTEPERGDVVMIGSGSILSDDRLYKRVIAVGGDSIEIRSDGSGVLLNGVPLEEPYVVGVTLPGAAYKYPLTIPEGFVFVMGDNREHSSDSRHTLGLVPVERIVGIVIGGHK